MTTDAHDNGGAARHPGLVLVAEDEFLIAMELQATLLDAGYAVLGPAATVATALGLLDQECPGAAVLDVNLGSQRVTPVAEALSVRDIPFVLASAYAPADLANEPLLASARNLGKPTSPGRLLAEIRRMLARSGSPG